ncbi:hypothetical protein HMPREF9582_02562 [Cutibacterium acnes HL060PA1]|nr:hypothetical protein HMPREF9619_01176 [Cutibacterium acnes HL082PA2]EFT65432.1 hypothetical protein HMPREF9582_02562 [Cutibacterium acnes HL060PA1]EGE68853.1 hypothetical protein HMPREF9341_02148 [Cutibacterium acnes HL103PA1]
MHYSEIAQRILDNGLRQQTGATPAATVAATIPPPCGRMSSA